MSVMGVAVQENLLVLHGEAKFHDALFDQRRGSRQARIQEDGSSRRFDIEGRNVRADIINVADDLKGLDGLVPGGALTLRETYGTQYQDKEWFHAIAATLPLRAPVRADLCRLQRHGR